MSCPRTLAVLQAPERADGGQRARAGGPGHRFRLGLRNRDSCRQHYLAENENATVLGMAHAAFVIVIAIAAAIVTLLAVATAVPSLQLIRAGRQYP